eukprot:3137853-Rhodomonas_salina.1
MQEHEAPRVRVERRALYCWKLSDGFWVSCDRRREGDIQQWEKYDDWVYGEAIPRIQAAFDKLL